VSAPRASAISVSPGHAVFMLATILIAKKLYFFPSALISTSMWLSLFDVIGPNTYASKCNATFASHSSRPCGSLYALLRGVRLCSAENHALPGEWLPCLEPCNCLQRLLPYSADRQEHVLESLVLWFSFWRCHAFFWVTERCVRFHPARCVSPQQCYIQRAGRTGTSAANIMYISSLSIGILYADHFSFAPSLFSREPDPSIIP
jgi:hypothetical protein